MKRLTSIQETYLAAARVFHFAFREHFVLWFAGRSGRHWRTEHVLPALVKKGALIALRYGKRTLYAVPDRVRMAPSGNQVAILPYHGLACTDILTRYVLADPTGEVLSENVCRANRWGAVPEWGIRYPQGTALLLEFCTADNVERGKVAAKVAKYRHCLPAIEDSLQAKAVVVFVLDVPPHAVSQLSRRLGPRDPFFCVDYQAFQAAANVLTTPMYLWADGQAYPLKKMIDLNLLRTILVGKNLPAGVQYASHEALPAAGLTMGTLYLGRPGSGKTSALARHIVDDFFAHPDQAIFVLDKSGDATNKILALIGQRTRAEREAAKRRLVYEELGHPDWVLPLPELSLDYGGDYEDEIGRVRANLDGLFDNPSLDARILAGLAINKTLPEIFRLLVSVRNQYGETWQVTEVERLLGNLDRLRALVKNRQADLPPATYDFLNSRLLQLRPTEGELRTYILTELFEGLRGNYMQGRLGYFKPVWTPKEAIARGQMVIIDGSRLINQPKALDYAFVQVYSLVKAEINRRQPADPHDRPVSLVLDETKKLFDTPTFAREIGEISPLYRSRKLQLYVVLQGLFQLNRELKEQIWTMGNIVAFALENKDDAKTVARQLFRYNPTQEKLPAKTTTQNPTAEPETGQDRQVADWIHSLGFRQCLVKRYLSERQSDPYVRYVHRTKSWPRTPETAAQIKARVRDFKDDLLKLRGVPIRQALEVVNARNHDAGLVGEVGPRQL